MAVGSVTSSPGRSALHPGRRRNAMVLLLFVVLSCLLFAGADLHATSSFIGATSADPSQHAWFLSWLPHAISARINPLFSTQIVEPTGVNLLWNTWIPLPALLLSPITLLSGPVASFDVAVTLGVALSAWCMYLAANHFVHRTWAAMAAGAAYGFSPFIMGHALVGHSNLVIGCVPPLLLIVIDNIVVRQNRSSRRDGLLLGLLMAAQFFVTEELLASEVVAVAIGLTVLAVLRRREVAARWRHIARAFGFALLVFVPLAAYPVWYQFFGPRVPQGGIVAGNFTVTDLLNLLLPTDAQGVEPGFAHAVATNYAGNSGEWGGYIGVPMLVILAWAVWRWRGRLLVQVAALCGLAFVLLSFGSTLHVAGFDTRIPMPGIVLAHLPVLEDLLPARFALYVALMAALLLAIALASAPPSRRARQALAFGLILVACSYVPPLPFPSRAANTPPFFTVSPRPYPPDAELLVVPFSHDYYSADAMLWQAQAAMSFGMPEGYIVSAAGAATYGPPPSTTSSVLAALSAGSATGAEIGGTQRQQIAVELKRWRITGVVFVPTGRNDAVVLDFLVSILGSANQAELGVTFWPLSPQDR